MKATTRAYSPEAARAQKGDSHHKLLTAGEWPEQEQRRVWRVLRWTLEARLVAVDEDLETFEQAFLSYLVDPATDRTMWEAVRDLVEGGAFAIGGPGLRELEAGVR